MPVTTPRTALALATYAITLLACSHADAAKPGGCQRTHSQRLAFSDAARPDTVLVRASATRADCKDTKLTVTVRNAAGRLIWTESAVLSLVNSGRFPDEAGVEIPPGDIGRAVDGWVSVEKASDAPAWQGAGLVAASDDPQQFDTPLARSAYLRIRAAGGPMLCIAVGPESAHCIAIDPATGKPVVLFNRGI